MKNGNWIEEPLEKQALVKLDISLWKTADKQPMFALFSFTMLQEADLNRIIAENLSKIKL